MKLKRFNSMNEAKSTKEVEEKALNYIQDELKKMKMSRYDIIKKIKNKFEDDKVANKIADEITHTLNKKLKIKNDSYNKGKQSNIPYYYLGDDAKEPTGVTKKSGKTDKKDDKKKGKVSRFDEFDEKEAQKAKEIAEKDIKDDKKGDKSDRQINFSKDSTKQLIAKLRNKKYEKYWDEMEEILDNRASKN